MHSKVFLGCAVDGSGFLRKHAFAQDPTGEAASDAQKHLTLYELDLGLNHVVRKWSEPVDNGANLLVPVGPLPPQLRSFSAKYAYQHI